MMACGVRARSASSPGARESGAPVWHARAARLEDAGALGRLRLGDRRQTEEDGERPRAERPSRTPPDMSLSHGAKSNTALTGFHVATIRFDSNLPRWAF